MDVVSLPTWRGFDAWLKRDPSRRPEQIAEHAGICHQCDTLVGQIAHPDEVTPGPPSAAFLRCRLVLGVRRHLT